MGIPNFDGACSCNHIYSAKQLIQFVATLSPSFFSNGSRMITKRLDTKFVNNWAEPAPDEYRTTFAMARSQKIESKASCCSRILNESYSTIAGTPRWSVRKSTCSKEKIGSFTAQQTRSTQLAFVAAIPCWSISTVSNSFRYDFKPILMHHVHSTEYKYQFTTL